MVDTELEEAKSKLSAKFIRIPLIVHTTLKRENSFTLQIEHLQVRRTTINIPRDVLNLNAEIVGEHLKEVYPNAKSFIVQYEERDGESIPFCAQIFLAGKTRERRYHPIP